MTDLGLYEESRKSRRKVFLMDKGQIEHYWPQIVQVLGEVPGYYEFFTPEWTYTRAMNKDLQVWGFTDGEIRGIAVTQILVFPARKAFEILAAGGSGMLDFLDEMEEVFDRIALQTDCDMVIARARPGLARKLAHDKGMVQGAVWIYRKVERKREH